MTEDDLKAILSKYQQKCFDLFNANIVLETQIESLQKQMNILSTELEKLRKPKRGSSKVEGEFE